jgi:hypothetical protein
MNKAEFELIKKAFASNKEAEVLYFTGAGKDAHTDAEQAAIAGKEVGYKVVRRKQLEKLEANFKTAKDETPAA